MRAVVVDEFGGPEVLALRDVPEPEPGPGEVAIDVAYVGVNFADVTGRASGYLVSSLPFVPGLEAAGHVRALGAGVSGLAVGQSVTAMIMAGAYADVVVAQAALTYAVPDGMELRMAAALPIVLPTAHALVHETARLGAGESVLVHGAAGGVGTVVGQIARQANAGAVYGVVSTADKARYALDFGYDEVFLTADFDAQARAATDGRGVDVALDSVGGETWRRSLALLAPFGRLVSFGNAAGEEPWTAGFAALIPNAAGAHAFSISTLSRTAPQVLRPLAERAFALVAEGKVEMPITAEFDLQDAAEAHVLLESRASTGKIVLRVGSAQ
ncbi:MAG: NADPH:quinone reductase [Solirubrobacteraceae bacterium]